MEDMVSFGLHCKSRKHSDGEMEKWWQWLQMKASLSESKEMLPFNATLTIWSCDVEVGNIDYPHQEEPKGQKVDILETSLLHI